MVGSLENRFKPPPASQQAAHRTTRQAWKDTLPAFVMPCVFVCDAAGYVYDAAGGGLWAALAQGAAGLTSPVTLETLCGIAVFNFACQDRPFRKSTAVKTALFVAAGILLVFAEPIAAIVGLLRLEFRYPHAVAFVLAAVAVLMQWMWPERAQPRPS